MIAMKLIGRGVEFLEFRSDGTYTAYMSSQIPKVEGDSLDIDGTYLVVAFGKYSRGL